MMKKKNRRRSAIRRIVEQNDETDEVVGWFTCDVDLEDDYWSAVIRPMDDVGVHEFPLAAPAIKCCCHS